MGGPVDSLTDATATGWPHPERHSESNLSNLVRLHEIGAKSVQDGNLEELLREVLDTVMALTHAPCGTIQLIDPSTRHLRIVTGRGLRDSFVDFFNSVEEKRSACSAALERGRRVVIEDTAVAPEYTEAAREVVLTSGIRACQSTPLVSRGGEVHRGHLDALPRAPPLHREGTAARRSVRPSCGRLHRLQSTPSGTGRGVRARARGSRPRRRRQSNRKTIFWRCSPTSCGNRCRRCSRPSRFRSEASVPSVGSAPAK